jgi:hypothetical protein
MSIVIPTRSARHSFVIAGLVFSGARHMGVSLLDCQSNEVIFDVNFWHYRAIVEAIRGLGVLSDAKVDSLHECWCGNGLSANEARAVASLIRSQLMPTLADSERLMLDGTRTAAPDDGTLFLDAEQHKNYSTNVAVLERFAQCCETSNGFIVC